MLSISRSTSAHTTPSPLAPRQPPLQVRLYAGASGDFVLYEDDGHSAAHQSGAYTRIRFTHTPSMLTIAAREVPPP